MGELRDMVGYKAGRPRPAGRTHHRAGRPTFPYQGCSHYLNQFNLGVVYSNRLHPMNDTLVRVWRVKVKFRDGADNGNGASTGTHAVGLEAVECLSSFNEECLRRLYRVHLQGPMIAYSAKLYRGYSGDYIVLFDWSQANGRAKNEGIQRWYNGPTLLALVCHQTPCPHLPPFS